MPDDYKPPCETCDGDGWVWVKNYPLWPEDKRNWEEIKDECPGCGGSGVEGGGG